MLQELVARAAAEAERASAGRRIGQSTLVPHSVRAAQLPHLSIFDGAPVQMRSFSRLGQVHGHLPASCAKSCYQQLPVISALQQSKITMQAADEREQTRG